MIKKNAPFKPHLHFSLMAGIPGCAALSMSLASEMAKRDPAPHTAEKKTNAREIPLMPPATDGNTVLDGIDIARELPLIRQKRSKLPARLRSMIVARYGGGPYDLTPGR